MLDLAQHLGAATDRLLTYQPQVSQSLLQVPGRDWIERVWGPSDRSPQVLRSLQQLYGAGQLANTGYLSLLVATQGVEQAAGATFATQPLYFNPAAILDLALETGCSGIVAPYGVVRGMARRYAHRLPLVIKLNHNELLSYPNRIDPQIWTSVEAAWNLGAIGVAASVSFGAPESNQQLAALGPVFERAHEWGMATLLWSHLRNPVFLQGQDYQLAADLTGQANYLASALGADILIQRLPDADRGYQAVIEATGKPYGKTSDRLYTDLTGSHPIDLARYQVLNSLAGRAALLHSVTVISPAGSEAVQAAVINKRAGAGGVVWEAGLWGRSPEVVVGLVRMVHQVYESEAVTVG